MSDKIQTEGYKKVRASELPREEQERLRNVLRQELAEALIKSVRAEPPDVDLTQIEVVLRPSQEIRDWGVMADCSTCSTCGTCGTCSTCSTASVAEDIPAGVARELGISMSRPQVDVKSLQRNLQELTAQLAMVARAQQSD